MHCSRIRKNIKRQRKTKRDWRKVDNMKNLSGGSPASDLVMADTMKNPILMDHVLPPRIRQNDYDDGFPNPMCGGSNKTVEHSSELMKGGSLASDMVMQNLSEDSQTKKYLSENKVEANMSSLNLYQTTGGGSPKKLSGGSRKRRSNRNKRTKKSSKQRGGYSKGKAMKGGNPKKMTGGSNCNSKKMNGGNPKKMAGGFSKGKAMKGGYTKKQMGGGSDWIMSNYSQGNINAPAQPLSWTNQFSNSQPSDRDMLMNPPTLGLAGSGYPMGSLEGANVRMTGAPLS